MHRTKKITVTAMAAALLMAGGVSSAMADPAGKVTICHRTGSDKHPYHKITISENALHAHIGEDAHPAIHGRVDVYPDANGNCPGPTTPPNPNPNPEPENGADCSASNTSGDSTQSQHGLVNVGNVNLGLNNLLANGFCHSNVGNGLAIAGIGHAVGGYVGDDSDDDGDCSVDSTSGTSTQEQDGLVNIGNLNLGLNNLLGNGFCGSNVLNGGAIAGIGEAIAGDTGESDSGDGDCIASSDSGDSDQIQIGGVNVGNINAGGNNLLANGFCGANVLNGLGVAGIGYAEGGYVGDSGDGDCIADSTSGDSGQGQFFGVNAGNLNLGGDNLLANAFCQADVLNGAAVSLIGPAMGGTTLGSGLLSGSPLDILGYSTSGLYSGLSADLSVVAALVLNF